MAIDFGFDPEDAILLLNPEIVFFSHSSYLLGAQRSLLTLVLGFSDLGYKCIVITFGQGGLVGELEKNNILTKVIPAGRSNKYFVKLLLRVLGFIPSIPIIMSAILKHKPDLVYVNTVDRSLPIVISKLLRVKVILHIREGEDYFEKGGILRKLNSFLALTLSSHFICNSIPVLNRIKRLTNKNPFFLNKKKPIVVIENGVFSEPTNTSVKPVLSNLRSHNNKFIIGYLGGGSKRKRLDIFIKGFIVAKLMRHNLHALIVGPSWEEFRIACKTTHGHKLDPCSFTLIPFTSDTDFWLKQMQVLCLTSDIESFGRVLVEAGVNHIPVISSNCEGPQSFLTNSETGLLFNKGDYRDLADKIVMYHDDPILRELVKRNFYNVIRRRFSTQSYIEKCLMEVRLATESND